MTESENVDTTANFWLPSDFLADDDFFPSNAKKSYSGSNNNILNTSAHSYTTATSLGSTPTTLGSPGDSSVTSSAEADENDNYRDELLDELTRKLAVRSTFSLGEQQPNARNLHSSREKIWGHMATSPQSTLSGFPGWSNRSGSGPTNLPTHVRSPTPPLSYEDKEEALELIYAAAGQVARMKMIAAEVQAQAQAHAHAQMRNLHQQNRGLLAPACNNISSSSVPFNFSHPNQFHQLKTHPQTQTQSKGGVWASQQLMHKSCFGNNGGIRPSFESGRCCAGGNENGCFSHEQPALSSVRVHQPKMYYHRAPSSHQTPSNRDCSGIRAVFLGPTTAAAPLKKQSTGTGVFLPRTHINNKVSTNTTEQPRKNKGCSTVLLPARVVQALNLNLQEDVNGRPSSHSHLLTSSNHRDILLMARRNAILAQQQRGRVMRPEVPIAHHPELLPQDWTY